MVCEGLFRLYDTSSKEIIERTKKEEAEFYQPKIDALSSANSELSSINREQSSVIDALTSEIKYLKNILTQHDISYNSET